MNKSWYIDTGPSAISKQYNIPTLLYNIYNYKDINITTSDKIYVKLTILMP